MDHRWLLEHDSEGEIYTRPRTDETLIREVLQLFNGSTVFYCCLSDTTDESCLWCVGEPKRRVIEGRIVDDEATQHFVLKKKAGGGGKAVTLKWGMEPNEVVKAEPSEVLTEGEAMAVFLAFFKSKKIPSQFEAVPKAYLFG